MTKRRNKKYNPKKRFVRMALDRLCVAWTDDNKEVALVDRVSGKQFRVDATYQHMLADLPHMWSILIAVFGYDHDGKLYMTSEQIDCNTPYRQADLCDFLNDKHRALIAGANPKRLAGAGWLAAPYQHQWADAEAFALLEPLMDTQQETGGADNAAA